VTEAPTEPERDVAARRAVKKALLELAIHAPFFATLALYAELVIDPATPTAATDGRRIYVSPGFFASLGAAERRALLAHEVLHAALLHPNRCGLREPGRWNVAADIVVNGIVRAQSWAELPSGALVDASLEALAVEEVYERLPAGLGPGAQADLLVVHGSTTHTRDVERHWALARASALAASRPGDVPCRVQREIDRLGRARIDWRAELARFVSLTRDDYGELDLRFVHRGLYVEALEREGLHVDVAVDTSGSISAKLLADFLAELRALLALYPAARGRLFFFEVALEGPFDLDVPPRRAVGGGGTSFVPFFERLRAEEDGAHVAVVLTDGHGTLPERTPDVPVLWVIPESDARHVALPFGTVARIPGR